MMHKPLPMIRRATISFRIGTPLWMPPERFRELMALFESHPGVTDEVTFFTSGTHACLPLHVIQERAERLADRLAQARARGYRAGVNLLSTIGHHNEDLPHALTGDYTPMTDIDGAVCEGSRCPNGENLRHYIREVYRALALAAPDYLWIDDDVRLFGHMPITACCFCEVCLDRFAAETGRRYSREQLKTAFHSGTLAERMAIRKAWLAHNRATLARLLAWIEATVHAVNPAMPLGFMTGDRFYDGSDFATLARILAGPRQVEVLWRPGGGFYQDESLRELLVKAHAVGRQVSLLPDFVTAIQSEIENFPYQLLKKTVRTTVLESAVHLAAGCTGTAFNVLAMADEPFGEYEPMVAGLCQARPFYDLMARILGRTRPQGLCAAWNQDSYAVAGIQAPNWFRPDNPTSVTGDTFEIFETGIPAAYGLHEAQVAAMTGDAPLAFSETDLKTLLSRGVYLDGQALARINEMGLGAHTGFSVARFHEDDCIEILLPHDLNGSCAGRRRDCRQSFRGWSVPAAELTPTSPAAQPLSRLINYGEESVAACGSGVFENTLGGRVFVGGYFPWIYLQNLPKTVQLKSVVRWLSRDKLPAYIESYHKINLWARGTEADTTAVALLNPSLDPARDVVLMLRTAQTEISVYTMACERTTVQATRVDGPYHRFVLPTIRCWQMVLVDAAQ